MLESLFYLILALLGIGLIIFIHELGHYFMARRVGMKVEAFGIGFGKPLYTWEHKGVKWHLCTLPFGGYVRIAGMEKKGSLEPYQIPDGFYGKTPWQRIKVAFMGPLVNIVFAFIGFGLIWMAGGREKSFSEYTHVIGWVDPQSKLYQMGVRSGDEITSYDHKSFNGFQDLFYGALLDNKATDLEINKVAYPIKSQEELKEIVGELSPAHYLIFDRFRQGSALTNSGIRQNDRIAWVDGEVIYSQQQLSTLLNEPVVLLTIKRGAHTFLTRVPRLKISDVRFSSSERAELDDWQHDVGLKTKVQQLFYIPYNLTQDAAIESPVSYLDACSEEQQVKTPLQKGDQILAVDGVRVNNTEQFLKEMQTRHVQIIVQREENLQVPSWKDADAEFRSSINATDLNQITQTVGLENPLSASGNLHLLNSVTPEKITSLNLTEEEKALFEKNLAAQRKEIEQIEDTKIRACELKLLEESQNRLVLGIQLKDKPVIYNPEPLSLFTNSLDEIWRTLKALVSGTVRPKGLAGPVGILQVIHHGWTIGLKEALFYMAMISLNLGIVNLLPIPVLDGGHICFSLYESITRRPLKAKTMEKLIIPFVFLIIGAFIYLTYNDLSRLFHSLF